MGASRNTIQNVFLIEGALIAFWGTAIGLFSGFVVGFIPGKQKILVSKEIVRKTFRFSNKSSVKSVI